ncbi:MAG: twin-arginine translocase subunit TatC [Candidatus Omnitrophica bacterium]|nr:twin-arginine translocase subunit TatC [Candidatus Omnitrophota bacterium]
MDGKTFPFVTHLEELRRRIIHCILAVTLTSVIAYLYKEKILLFLIDPIGKVFFLTLTEAFISYLKISVISGVLLASPYLIYQIWAFTWSAFHPAEKQYIVIYGILSLVLFLCGIIFAYAAGLSIAVNFFLGFAKDYLVPMISVNQYINFCLIFILTFGLLFEVPLIIIFMTSTGFVKIEQVAAKRKHIILAIFIIAAVVTPGPDVFTQFLVAILLYLLFEGSVLVARILKMLKRNNSV